MARCDLTIAFDDGRSTYRPGETVMGELTIETDGPVRVDDLVVELGYEVTGDRLRIVAEQSLFSGDVEGNARRSFPIRLNCPSGPHTHDGELVTVEWFVRARADVPWKIDPQVRQAVTMLPTGWKGPPATAEPDRSALSKQSKQSKQSKRSKRERPLRTAVTPSLLVAVSAVVLTAALVQELLERLPSDHPLSFLAVPVAVPAIVALLLAPTVVIWLRPVLAAYSLGLREFEVDRSLVKAGETVAWTVVFRPRRQLEVDRICARVVGQEERTTKFKGGSATESSPVFEEELELAGAITLAAGERVELHGSLRVPETAPRSLRGARVVGITWRVECVVERSGEPYWSASRGFTVRG